MSLRLLVKLGFLFVFSAVQAWAAEDIRVGPVYTDRAGDVSVVLEFKTPPEVISRDSFRLVAEGKTISIARNVQPFKDVNQPMAFIICVDVSGSMKGDPLEETRTALATFLSRAQARPEDRIALVSFADQDRTESSFDASHEQLDQAVRDLRVRGKFTRLYQTLARALNKFSDQQSLQFPKRRRIIVISDGKNEEQNNTDDSDTVGKKARSLGIAIDAIGRGKIEDQYTEALKNLANGTGGHYVFARPDRLALTDAIEQIYNGLLETRSWVVSFPYQRDPKGQIIQDASIELLQPGNTPTWTEKLPEGIPQPLVKSSKYWWLWLLTAAVLLGALYFILRPHPQQKEEVIVTFPTDSQTTGPSHPPPPPPSRRPTVVGGHYFSAPMPGQPTVVLAAVSGPLGGRKFPVEKATFLIGVNSENDLQIMNDDYVSGNHAYLHYESGNLAIFDKGSRNGTFVNQNQVPSAGMALNLGDRIQIGASTFEVTNVKN